MSNLLPLNQLKTLKLLSFLKSNYFHIEIFVCCLADTSQHCVKAGTVTPRCQYSNVHGHLQKPPCLAINSITDTCSTILSEKKDNRKGAKIAKTLELLPALCEPLSFANREGAKPPKTLKDLPLNETHVFRGLHDNI